MTTQHTESISELLTKAAPPVTVTSLNLYGVTLPDIVQIVTLVYLVVLVADKLYAMYQKYKEDKK
jgi:hypothetical protein